MQHHSMAQQHPLHEASPILEVLADKHKVIRYRVEVSLTRRSGRTLLKYGTQGIQSFRDLRKRAAETRVSFAKIGRRGHGGKMHRALAHVACRPRHRGCGDRHAVVGNLVVDDRELEPGGHLERVGHGGVDVVMDGGRIALVGIATARGGGRESDEHRNDRSEARQAANILFGCSSASASLVLIGFGLELVWSRHR